MSPATHNHRASRWRRAGAALLLLGASAAAGQPQPRIEEVELQEPEPAPSAGGPALDEERLETLFAEAEGVFLAGDPTAALPLFGHVVELLDAHVAERLVYEELTEPGDVEPGEAPAEDGVAEDGAQLPRPIAEVRLLSDRMRALLVRSLAYRAEVQAGFGERALAEAGFERMLTLDPGAGLDRERAPKAAVEVFDRLHRRLIGELVLTFEPPDVEVRIDGRPADPRAGPVSALAGERWLAAERLGYESLLEEIEVAAGRQTSHDFTLERSHPVLRLHTRPPGAEVVLDGTAVGITEGIAPEGFLAQGRYAHDEFSAEWTWTDLELGLRVLEIRKPGYRPYRAELRIGELIDYPMPPIVLEPEAGVLVFRNLPPGAEILVDGRPATPENPEASRPRLTLAPGEHEVQVTASATRMFTRSFLLADRQTVELEVQLRPGLAFVGALGGRGTAAATLSQALRRTLEESGKWALLDRSEAGTRALARLGVTAERLIAASGGSAGRAPVDWREIQRTLDREAPGLIYVAAALPGDLLASDAHVLIWPAAPGPPRPDVLKLPLGVPGATARVAEVFDRPIRLYRPWVGALLIDGAAPHPVVAGVTPGSPADGAGLALGDEIVAVDQHEVSSRAAFDAFVEDAGIDGTLELAVRTAAGSGRNATLRVGKGPRTLHPASFDGLPAIAFTDLSLLLESAGAQDRWLIELDRALLLLRAGEAENAVRLLRKVNAPQSSHGLSQATVDYWLAVALIAADGSYLDAARALLERAAGFEGARLEHHDGPFLAPRARARLLELGGS